MMPKYIEIAILQFERPKTLFPKSNTVSQAAG